MPLEVFEEYKKRSFCRDTECPVQLDLDSKTEGSPEYQESREKCRECGAWRFHAWLTERGFLILRPKPQEKVRGNEKFLILKSKDKQVI